MSFVCVKKAGVVALDAEHVLLELNHCVEHVAKECMKRTATVVCHYLNQMLILSLANCLDCLNQWRSCYLNTELCVKL